MREIADGVAHVLLDEVSVQRDGGRGPGPGGGGGDHLGARIDDIAGAQTPWTLVRPVRSVVTQPS